MPKDERINMRFEANDLEKLRQYASRRQFKGNAGVKVNTLIRVVVKQLINGEIMMREEFEKIINKNKQLEEENKRLKTELATIKKKYKSIKLENSTVDIRKLKEKIDLVFSEIIVD